MASPTSAHPTPWPLTAHEVSLVRNSLTALTPFATDLTTYFYAILFARYPEVRSLFPANMDTQRDRLLRGLLRIVDLVDDPDNFRQFCSRLGRDHRKFGTLTAHYPAVGECLLSALARYAGTAWTAETEAAWNRAYSAAARAMILAADDDTRLRPATWTAEIVQHRHHGHGIAEITVLPNLPYPYTAGQYVSMETPWVPRAWRHFSPAHRPRTDHRLTFHVRAVPQGLVSSALVYRARVGDSVLLGPPQGNMVLNDSSHRDLLCVAGGTGLAPIRALLDELAHGERRMRRCVDLFVGARTGEELYGFEDMLRMAQRHHWLTVRAAVSHQQIPGQQGDVPQVLRAFGPWYRHEAFLSGPPGMVSAAVQRLREAGIPRSHIHHDPIDVPVFDTPLAQARPAQENDFI